MHRTLHQRGLVIDTKYPKPNGTPGCKRNCLLVEKGYRCANPLCKLPLGTDLDPDNVVTNVHLEANHKTPLHTLPINKQNVSPNQILCKQCHKNKTAAERTALAAQKAANRAAQQAKTNQPPNAWRSKKRKQIEVQKTKNKERLSAELREKAAANAAAKLNQKKRHNDAIAAKRKNREYQQEVAKRKKKAARYHFQAGR